MEKDVDITRLIKKLRIAFDPISKEEAAGVAEAIGRIMAAIITTTKKEITL